ncbi:T9SS type A sorting domain-containing protein [Hyunsoonleella rubra]|uniref:T9SS type A sorting domain-containing protein n=1 Tax=Hyunsoonleella rubra TaxID=1737062 RepID=A0ABW5TDP9_9FLAO
MRTAFFVLTLLSVISTVQSQNTAIPDVNFEEYLETHDANGGVVLIGDDSSMGDGTANNGLVLTDRIANVESLIISEIGASDLTGIEDFSSLETLICSNNNLVNLDVSNNANLRTLLCSANELATLDVSNNLDLEDLDCSSNQIMVLNVASNTLLKSLDCSENRINALNVNLNTELTRLSVSGNRIGVLQVDNNVNLENLLCASNQLAGINLSANTNLKVLNLANNSIATLDLSALNTVVCPNPQTDPITPCQDTSSINVSNNQLTSLIGANGYNDLITYFNSENNPDLSCIQVDAGFMPNANWSKDDWTYYAETTCADIYTYVPDDNFELALIDLGHDTALDNLVLTANISGLLTLDVSNSNIDSLEGIQDFVALQTLNCSGNNIEMVDISNLSAFSNFNVSNNDLIQIDLGSNTNLAVLNISNNALNALDVSNNLALVNLDCSNNSIQSLDVSSLPVLTDFNCESNVLRALDMRNGQNPALSNFSAVNNTDLSCIETDTGAVPGGVTWAVDAIASYAINCGTYVPDDNFEQALVNLGWDTLPLDNYVPTANINAQTNLDISSLNISDLTGIEDFVALQTLNCSGNEIVTLNLVANTNLTSINCNNNPLEFVDIRNGNNINTTLFNATINPNLFCINVDPAVIGNIPAGWTIDPIATYNADCENNRYTPIPDNNFEQALLDLGIDVGAPDNQVLTASIEYLESLNISGENIQNLQGIKAFSSLIELDCSNNYLDELDVSGMVNLERLYCGSNYFLTSNVASPNGVLNITATPSLTTLFCADNDLADLNVTLNTNLEVLDCSNNRLALLDISNNTSLVELNCDNNQISNLTTYAADNFTLSELSCANNALTNLAVNRCLGLTELNCRANSLTQLNITANVVLEVLNFSDNELSDVNLSANTNLITLSGSNNDLSEINDVSSTVLERIILDSNQINELSAVLITLPLLKYLVVNGNQLTDLDARNNPNLIELNVGNNSLTSLELSANLSQLKTLNCSNNLLGNDLDLSTIGTGACPANEDFCPNSITINVSNNQFYFVNIQNGINNEISGFVATGNSNLFCIQVDDENNIGANWLKDAIAEYSTDCRFGETYVPDDNFEQALIDFGYDVGPLDDYVPTTNIEVVVNLDVSAEGIVDLTGIEDFIALEDFNCANNAISEVNLGDNPDLRILNLSGNIVSDVDLSANTNLVNLNISNNNFSEFMPDEIPTLQIFNCDENRIVELDFTANTALTNLSCTTNALEVLNLQNGQNPSLSNLDAQNNPALNCIQTDNGNAPAGVTWLKDTTTNYAIDCHFGETYVPDDNFEQALIDLGYDAGPMDDYVPTLNIERVTSLSLSNKDIADLTGIADFEALLTLDIEGNSLTTVDLSANITLSNLNASGNQFATLDISNLPNLQVLDVSGNSLSSIDTDSNLGLTVLNISGNLFTALDVSLLTDLQVLRCSGNQLEELDVTLNTKLKELRCSSNAFIQDKLNLQNGANAILNQFNATDNPDLSCILVDDPIAVISNVNGDYDSWFKDTSASYQTVCDDADNDGVANEDDLCPGTPFGVPVDLFGCRFSILPEDNFTILITDETCLNNNDGKINIVTKEHYVYNAMLTSDIFNKEYTFTNEINILNLVAGTYRLCLTLDEFPDFMRCYDIVIRHPEHLSVITGKQGNSKKATFQMSGSSNYHVEFNGFQFTTSESEIVLSLEDGANSIKISADLECQGTFEKQIFISDDTFIYPNPFGNTFDIYLGDLSEEESAVNVYSYLGQLVHAETVSAKEKRNLSVDSSHFSSGVYTVLIQSKSRTSTFKIVKK